MQSVLDGEGDRFIQAASIPYRQCSKYFHQYIDHLVVPRKNPVQSFFASGTLYLKVYS